MVMNQNIDVMKLTYESITNNFLNDFKTTL